MTNDQCPMNDQIPMMNVQSTKSAPERGSSLVMGHLGLIGHWTLVIGHSFTHHFPPRPGRRRGAQQTHNKVNRRFTGRELKTAVAAVDDETER
jgi:hypothetical protein